MHARTHTKPASIGQSGEGQSPYHDTMIDHDKNVGSIVDLINELGLAENTIVIWDWVFDHAFALYPLSDVVGEFLETFKEYPPRQKAGSFTIGKALESIQRASGK